MTPLWREDRSLADDSRRSVAEESKFARDHQKLFLAMSERNEGAVSRGGRGSVDLAKAASLPQQCVRITASATGKYRSPTNVRCDVELLSWLPRRGDEASSLWIHKCPVAISLLLRFFLEAIFNREQAEYVAEPGR